MYQNVYEVQSTSQDSCDDSSTVCCTDPDNNDVQYQLAVNDTQYIVYSVTPPSSSQANSFALAINVAVYDPFVHLLLSQSNVTIQPWQAYPMAGTAVSQDVADFSGSAILTNVGEEVYDVFQPAPHPTEEPFLLVQEALDDSGEPLNQSLRLSFIGETLCCTDLKLMLLAIQACQCDALRCIGQSILRTKLRLLPQYVWDVKRYLAVLPKWCLHRSSTWILHSYWALQCFGDRWNCTRACSS